jgi:hypothetical protein
MEVMVAKAPDTYFRRRFTAKNICCPVERHQVRIKPASPYNAPTRTEKLSVMNLLMCCRRARRYRLEAIKAAESTYGPKTFEVRSL